MIIRALSYHLVGGREGGLSERAFSPSIRSFEEEQVVLRLPGDHVMEETEKRFLWV